MKKSLFIMVMVGLMLCFPLLAEAGDVHSTSKGKVPGYNTPQKLDNGLRWMLACHTQTEVRYGTKHAEEIQWCI